jgi:aminoglycoside phosphotransferase (APT) family kinase protein
MASSAAGHVDPTKPQLNRVAPITAAHAASLLCEIDTSRCADAPVKIVELMSLWSGLGCVYLLDEEVVLKHISWRGIDLSSKEQRQVESYRVEAAFFTAHAPRLLASPRALAIPRPLLVRVEPDGITICMTRLYGDVVAPPLPLADAPAALEWLAELHAAFWGIGAADLQGLAADGSYWHLGIRGDELGRMPVDGWEGRLRLAARALDARLKADAMQTCIHGDSKPANMLYLRDAAAPRAQMFDWQYVGRAPPAKDLANVLTYVTGLDGGDDERRLVARYHDALCAALRARGVLPPPLSALAVSLELAVADLARWICGTGWKTGARTPPIQQALRERARAVVDAIDGGSALADEAAYCAAIMARFPVDGSG